VRAAPPNLEQSLLRCGLPVRAAPRSCLRWALNRWRRSTARPSGPQRRKPPAPGARLMRLLAPPGTCACSASKVQPQPFPALVEALNAGYRYLEVKCLGCNTHQTVALDIVRRPKTMPVHELERYMRCRQCSEVRRYPHKRSHLIALRPTKISADDPPSTGWPGER
jgi:hypothetical protein